MRARKRKGVSYAKLLAIARDDEGRATDQLLLWAGKLKRARKMVRYYFERAKLEREGKL